MTTQSVSDTETDEAGLPTCRGCGSARLRRSRFRSGDVGWLIAMHWPVRCLVCGKRQYRTLNTARAAQPSTRPHAAVKPETGKLGIGAPDAGKLESGKVQAATTVLDDASARKDSASR